MSTGAAPQRLIRSSQLLFGWQARHLSLDAYTGQVGRFFLVESGFSHTVVGRNELDITGGVAMPRWEQAITRGLIPRLNLNGDTPGSAQERLEWPWPLRVMALSMYVKVWPQYAAGADLGTVIPTRIALSMGNDPADGGVMTLRRIAATWQAYRQRGGPTISSAVTEPGTVTFPIELLATLSSGGTITLHTRDAAATPVLASGAPATDANMAITTEQWAGNILYSGGGAFRLEAIKIARGVQTFATMDLLS